MNERVTEELRAFEEDQVWISDHIESLLSQYADQWIAVQDGQVVASDPVLAVLQRKLPDPAHTCIEFVTREPLEMILRSSEDASLKNMGRVGVFNNANCR